MIAVGSTATGTHSFSFSFQQLSINHSWLGNFQLTALAVPTAIALSLESYSIQLRVTVQVQTTSVVAITLTHSRNQNYKYPIVDCLTVAFETLALFSYPTAHQHTMSRLCSHREYISMTMSVPKPTLLPSPPPPTKKSRRKAGREVLYTPAPLRRVLTSRLSHSATRSVRHR